MDPDGYVFGCCSSLLVSEQTSFETFPAFLLWEIATVAMLKRQ